LAGELAMTNLKDREAVLARYSKTYGVTFFFCRPNGVHVAGPPQSLPEAVLEHLKSELEKSPFLQRLEKVAAGGRGGLPPLPGGAIDIPLDIVDETPFFAQTDSGYWVVIRMPLRAADQPGMQPGVLILKADSFIGTPFLFNLKPWLALAGAAAAIVL